MILQGKQNIPKTNSKGNPRYLYGVDDDNVNDDDDTDDDDALCRRCGREFIRTVRAHNPIGGGGYRTIF